MILEYGNQVMINTDKIAYCTIFQSEQLWFVGVNFDGGAGISLDFANESLALEALKEIKEAIEQTS